MSFVLSKIVWALLAPGTLLLIAVTLAFLLHRRHPRASRALNGLAVIVLAALALTPLSYWIDGPLERRFPPPVLAERVDGIIVLGGALDAIPARITGQPELNDAAERLTAFVELSRRYPQAKLVYTGGSGLVLHQDVSESDIAERLFAALGLPPERIVFERKSRNTWENAVFSQSLVHPQPGERWLLVTSAWHMPRAVGCFRRIGWNVTPYPVDHVGANANDWLGFNVDVQLRAVTLGMKEWIGLVSYRLMDRTSALLPAP
jgi:uncharacterized SAM-binding protein YcdF (DUF218 family)